MKNENMVDRVWSQTTATDRVVILGHSEDILSDEDRVKFARLLAHLSRKGQPSSR